MAESAAMAWAAALLNQLQSHQATIFSDNQQVVHFLNGPNLSNPPDWRIKPYIQITVALLSGTNSVVRRIKRTQNQMADSLARQTLCALQTNQIDYSGLCTNLSHGNDCPILRAINDVTINDVMILTALCC